MRTPELAPDLPNMPSGDAHALRHLDSNAVAALLTASCDLALVVDREGVIRDQSVNSDELNRDGYARWLNQPWIETVTIESRAKIESLLRDTANDATPKWRQVNHPSLRGVDVSMMYSTIRLGGDDGRNVAVGRRLGTQSRTARDLPRSVDQVTELIGPISLKQLVREATDVIELRCIEAALELTGDNRASAAEMLGLSRQSFYVKMRRHGLGDLAPETED